MLSYSINGTTLINYVSMGILFILLVIVLMVFIWYGSSGYH